MDLKVARVLLRHKLLKQEHALKSLSSTVSVLVWAMSASLLMRKPGMRMQVRSFYIRAWANHN